MKKKIRIFVETGLGGRWSAAGWDDEESEILGSPQEFTEIPLCRNTLRHVVTAEVEFPEPEATAQICGTVEKA